jgi:ferredoxin-NADP reductase
MLQEFLKCGRQATLLYSTRTASEAAFLGELRALAVTNPSLFRLVVTVTGVDLDWVGLTGRITRNLISEEVHRFILQH